MIRTAQPDDLESLVLLENEGFEDDRISRKSYAHLIKNPTASVFVEVDDTSGEVRGSLVLLFRNGLAIARIYSVVVGNAHRGKGFAKALINVAQEEAIQNECLVLRLEVREDNPAAIALYHRMDFRQFGSIKDYYDDGATALRFEKATVDRHEPPYNLDIPYYEQTFDFTCGAASLMMALKFFDDNLELSRRLEVELWREATTVFMTSGIGGCSAEGLALAAIRRGLDAQLITNELAIPFVNSVRNKEKKEAIKLVHETFIEALEESGHSPVIRGFGKEDIMAALDRKAVPMLLISGYRLYKERTPHWVVATGYDEHFIYIHDPYIPEDPPAFVGRHVPIYERDFMKMNRYGKAGKRTMVIIEKAA